ncbi:hypothetical protein HOY80DRAFT_1072667 [Tuber brumale]|nr:hypothetical protein HOY80DRAFT_1072667 [Tuber brumale]
MLFLLEGLFSRDTENPLQDLYCKLWGKELPLIQVFTARVPQAGYSIRPGYKMTTRPSVRRTFSPLRFTSKRQQQLFKMVEVGTNLPLIRHRLIRAEEARWVGVSYSSGNQLVGARLGYEVYGQPGTGMGKCEAALGHEISSKPLSRITPREKRKLWVLAGETVQNQKWHMSTAGWFIVLAASPEKVKASRQWQKERNPAVYFMGTWELPEIFAAYSLGLAALPTHEQINKLFGTFACLGSVVRTFLRPIDVRSGESYNENLHIYLSQVDREIEGFIAHGGPETIEHTVHQDSSHRMAVMRLPKTDLSYKAVYEMGLRALTAGLFPSLQTLFLSIKSLKLGGAFTTNEIPSAVSKSCTLNYFTTPEDLASQGLKLAAIEKYFIPFSHNYEAVDRIVFSDLGHCRQNDYSRTQNIPDSAAFSTPGAHLDQDQADMQSVAI